jgi:hypothetical protein
MIGFQMDIFQVAILDDERSLVWKGKVAIGVVRARNVCRATIFKVLGLFPVDQIVVIVTGVLPVLNISGSILTDKDIVVIQIVENGLRETSSFSARVKSRAQILVEIPSVALDASVRDSRIEIDGVGTKAAVPVKGVAFPSTNDSVLGANLALCVTVGACLAEHAIERVGRTVANQIVGGRLEIKASLVEGRIRLAIVRAWYRTPPLHGIVPRKGADHNIVLHRIVHFVAVLHIYTSASDIPQDVVFNH